MALSENKAYRIANRIVKTLSKYLGKIVTYILNVILTLLLVLVLSGSIMGAAMVIYVTNYIDGDYDIENLQFDSNLTTSLYYASQDETGKEIWVELEDDRLSGEENRIWVSYNDIPKDLINAFVSVEDKRFFNHNGIDLRRIAGAGMGFLTGNDSYGASTITQQLIKNVSNDRDVTLQRKITEILRALSLESKKSKEEILEMYLNTIYLSQGCYGVQAAANKYFGKDVSQLTLVECAALASITQYPTKWDPIQNPENNKERRHTVLVEMHNNGYINYDQYYEADAAELVLADGTTKEYTEKIHNYYVNQVMDDVLEDLENELGLTYEMSRKMLFSGGLKIYTAMDKDVQDQMELLFENEELFSLNSGVQPEAAMVIIDNATGNVAGLVGGLGKQTVSRGLNRATKSFRQPGSAIKPLSVYSLALENGFITYGSSLDDTPHSYSEALGRMWPQNTPNRFEGFTTLENAISTSKNTTAVKLLEKLTPALSYRFLTEKYNFTSLVEADLSLSPLALGGLTYGVSTLEMAAAYATIPNNGIYKSPRTYLYVEDSSGQIILNKTTETKVIISADTANTMNLLLGNVVEEGTAKALTLSEYVNCAGKTGTTNDEKDLYFCGYTPYYTASVWVGYDIPKSLDSYVSKFKSANKMSPTLYIWNTVMKSIHNDLIEADKAGTAPLQTFDAKSRLIQAEYCLDSGLLAGEACKNYINGDRTAVGFFTESTLPRSTCDRHVCVSWCVDTKSVAGPSCSNTKEVGFLKIDMSERYFERSIKVSDAQFTVMNLPEGYVYPSSTKLPYYINLYPTDRYPGTSGAARPANCFCVEHNPMITDAYLPWERPIVDVPEEQTP